MRCKRLLSLALAAAMLFGSAALLPEDTFSFGSNITASAEVEGDYEYAVYSSQESVIDEGKIHIIKYNGKEKNAIIPSEINGKQVVTIDSYAFSDCKSIQSITIPNTVRWIDQGSFGSCTNLRVINLSNSIEGIGNYCFSDCTSIEKISIPKNTYHIGEGAFSKCASLKNINVDPDNNDFSSVGGALYDKKKTKLLAYPSATGSIIIPSSVKEIASRAFYNCEKLKEIILPNGIKNIYDETFSGCLNLSSVTFSDELTSIGNSAFYNCMNLSDIRLPNSVEIIDSLAFCNCKSIKEINLPDKLIQINSDAFFGCEKLSKVSIHKMVGSIGENAFKRCNSLLSVTIPKNVSSIGAYAFGYLNENTKINGFKILCYEGSEAEKYAKENEFDYEYTTCTEHEYIKTIVPATCNRGEHILHTCKLCGDSYVTDEQPAPGHKFGKWETQMPDGPENDGIAVSKCKVCGEEKTEPLKKEAYGFIFDTLSDGTIKITKFHPYYTQADGTVNIPSQIIGRDVTIIGSKAFDNGNVFSALGDDEKIKKIIIPDTVTTIGDYAFTHNKKLTDVVMSQNLMLLGDHSFDYCPSLTNINLPKSLQYIGEHAFDQDCFIKQLYISDNVSHIGKGYLPRMDVDKDSTKYCQVDGVVFSKDMKTLIKCPCDVKTYKVPEGVETIEDYAFSGDNGSSLLVSVELPKSLVKIGANAFSYSLLQSITIPSGVREIGDEAFGHTRITELKIPATVQNIGRAAFTCCDKLSKITLANGLKTIPDNMFSGCWELLNFNIPNSVTTIGDNAFSGCGWFGSVIIPNSVKSIGKGAFNGCISLGNVTMPKSSVRIGDNAFEGTPWFKYNVSNKDGLKILNGNLMDASGFKGKELTVPKGIHTIMRLNCRAEKINIPASVTLIEPEALYGIHTSDIYYVGNGGFEINVDPKNPYYSSLNGALYNKNKTKLIYYPYTKKTFNIPKTVKIIGKNACVIGFDDYSEDHNVSDERTGLSSFTIPDHITEIEDFAFHRSNLTGTVVIPGSVKKIGNSAFSHTEIKKLIIKDGVKSIGSSAFFGLNNLTDASIPKSVNFFGSYALGSVYTDATTWVSPWLKKQVEKDPMVIINGIVVNGELCSSEELVIPDGVKMIAGSAFANSNAYDPFDGATFTSFNRNIKEIVLPNSVKYIGDYAFYGCTDLEKITVPNNLEYLGEKAFGYFDSSAESSQSNSSLKITDDSVSVSINATGTPKRKEDAKVSCYYGSKGERYAIENGFAYTIKNNDVSKANCSADIALYTGKPVYPTVTVSINGKVLIKGTDYTIEYSENIEKGKGHFKVTGIGRFKGTCSGTFDIGASMDRLAGTNRFSTAVAISKASYPDGADTVILAFGLNYADALAGVPLAEKLNAPILLTHIKTLPDETLAEIKRLGAKNVIILGGEGAISKDVEKTLKKQGLKTRRLAGKTRFETATTIAEKLNDAPTDVFFVYAFNSADALSVSTVAALKYAPIIYLSTKGDLNADTAAYLAKLREKGCVKNAYVIGGNGVISDAMMKKVANALGLKVNKTVQRVAGKNRYETCVEVNNKFKDVLTGTGICVAKGLDFPDALAGGVYAASTKQALFLADGKKLQDCQNSYLKGKNASKITVFGGTGAVPDSLVKLIAKASV